MIKILNVRFVEKVMLKCRHSIFNRHLEKVEISWNLVVTWVFAFLTDTQRMWIFLEFFVTRVFQTPE